MLSKILKRSLAPRALLVSFATLVGASGFAFSTEPANAAAQTLYSFCAKLGCTDGTGPSADLIMDSAGNLFGTTLGGGGRGSGTVFEVMRNPQTGKWARRIIYSFCAKGYPCSDGTSPAGRLVVDVSGNLYGVTTGGGNANSGGMAYELVRNASTDKWTYMPLYPFCMHTNCPDGKAPAAGLTYMGELSGAPYDGVSPLYGTTEFGGAHGQGLAYRLTPPTNGGKWSFAPIYNFCSLANCADGALPWQSLTMDTRGNLYGVTYGRTDVAQAGLVFELTSSSGHWTETVLHRFCQAANCTDGRAPNALVMDASGGLFGTAYGGGAHGQGLLFKLVPNGVNSAYTVLYNFCSQSYCYDGAAPSSSLMIDAGGNLYGTTYYGGMGQLDRDEIGGGTVFRRSPSGSYTVLQNFCSVTGCADGEYPNAGVVMDASGALFGTTQLGGRYASMYQGGTVFRLMH
jgi:uncharacterized repeat protein (TIGR03803 family)